LAIGEAAHFMRARLNSRLDNTQAPAPMYGKSWRLVTPMHTEMHRLALTLVLLTLAGVIPTVNADEPDRLDRRALSNPDTWAALETAARREIHVTARNKKMIRRRLRRAIWDDYAPRRTVPLRRDDSLGGEVRGARSVYALDIQLEQGLRARPVLFRSAQPPKHRLVIYHAGHERPVGVSSRRQVEFFLARGYDVAALSMPLYEFKAPRWLYEHPVCGKLPEVHDILKCLRRPLRPFLAPVAITLNTLARRYRSIDMAGFSGGGWTTVVAAAIDKRIRRSYSIAGTWPGYLMRYAGRRGDLEFEYPPMLRAATYLDMYALANRQLAIWIERDKIFPGTAFRSFVPAVRRVNPGFRARLDITIGYHGVSLWALRVIGRDMRSIREPGRR
jgi:hypothetical protein